MAAIATKKDLSVAQTSNSGIMTLDSLVSTKETQELIAKTLGKARVQTFVGSALTVAQNPNLKDVEPQSLFNCLLKSATYNFPIDPALSFAYPVPYKDKDGNKIAQFQLGTRGVIELAFRTNKYKRLNVKEVKSTEIVGIDFFGEEQIKWDTSPNRDKLPTIGYMAAFELTNGMTKRLYWSNEKIMQHANKYSKAHQYAIKSKNTSDDLWSQNFDAMARKTLLKTLITQFGPKSLEMQNAFQFDQSVIKRKNGIETAEYVDSTSDPAIIIEEDKVYDINETTGEVNEIANEKIVEQIANNADEEGIEYIDYEQYKNEKDIWVRMPYPDGTDPYDKETRKIRVRRK